MVNQVGGRRRNTVHAIVPNIAAPVLLCASNGMLRSGGVRRLDYWPRRRFWCSLLELAWRSARLTRPRCLPACRDETSRCFRISSFCSGLPLLLVDAGVGGGGLTIVNSVEFSVRRMWDTSDVQARWRRNAARVGPAVVPARPTFTGREYARSIVEVAWGAAMCVVNRIGRAAGRCRYLSWAALNSHLFFW